MNITENLLKYGVSTDLAARAESVGLSVSKCRPLSLANLVKNFGLNANEAKEIAKCVKRSPIETDVLHRLIERNNALCCVCKGDKGKSFVVHHIIPYEQSRDNSYSNLVVLCLNDHDMAHQSGLSMKLDPKFLRRAKNNWEQKVERQNELRASQLIHIDQSGIDYININRVEELCISLFEEIPTTNLTGRLVEARILNKFGSFDKKYVQENLSSGSYLFDYITHGETQHYKYLLQRIAGRVEFVDLRSYFSVAKLKENNLCGRYTTFVGGVYSKSPGLPLNGATPPIKMHYKKRSFRVEWILDPSYMMSVSAIARLGTKTCHLIYSLVRSVHKQDDGTWLISCSPIFVCLPPLNMGSHKDLESIISRRDLEIMGAFDHGT
ncbi:HNH endonuclease signature motif containing protein [Shewanella sp. YLB-07]|uniref:HNH endonuclease signature motif containing protein n=1 Tax=Shewanella sp. YLB-07 TaxID=2601268 RepID=UPI00128B0068|nr:HNH endonuclease signature motif containing protein [Shewanella sp. YLB-07]MPY24295.1 HNH endonuclease [Shewanella sp. YLB-07]